MSEQIVEARRITKVNSRGEKKKRVKCPRGYKLNSNKTSCVPITGSEKASKRKSIKKAVRTKRSKGEAFKKRTTKKRIRALKKRKAYGL